MKLTTTTLVALFGSAQALSQINPTETGLVQQEDLQVLAQTDVERKRHKKRRRRKSKSCSRSKSKHSKKSRPRRPKRSRSHRRSYSKHSHKSLKCKGGRCRSGSCNSGVTYHPRYTCTEVEQQCDIIMAHGYKEVFASSTLDVPFGYTKMAQQAIDTEWLRWWWWHFKVNTQANDWESNYFSDQDFNF